MHAIIVLKLKCHLLKINYKLNELSSSVMVQIKKEILLFIFKLRKKVFYSKTEVVLCANKFREHKK